MRSISVVAADNATEQRLLSLYGDELAVRRVWSNEWREPAVAVLEICAANPSVVVLAGIEAEDAEVLASDIDRRDPGIGVLVLIGERDTDTVVKLLRAGARDVLSIDDSDAQLRESLDSILRLMDERQRASREKGNGPPRRVIAVTGPKGGAGKTTIATNLAAGAAARFPGNVLLIDLDTQFGDVSSALGLQPEHSIADARSVGLSERTALKVFLTMHSSGLAVLAAPDSLEAAADLSDDDIKRTLAAFIEEYPLVIIDTAAGIDEASLVALEFASDLMLVSTPDVPAIRAVKKQLDALDQIGMKAPRRHLVINRSDARVGLSTDEMEDTIGLTAQFLIPGSRNFPMSTNEGVPLVVGERRDKATKQLEKMIDFFAPEPAQLSTNKAAMWLRRKES